MLPSIFGENLFDDWFGFPEFRDLRNVDRRLYGKNASREMRTDVHEHDDHYALDIDLPGFKKDEITLELENGCLTVTASKGLDRDEKNAEGKVIRKERFAGTMSRSFYVGENVTEQDIKAKFEDGVLTLTIPKIDQPKLPERKTIAIE